LPSAAVVRLERNPMDYGQSISALKAAHTGLIENLKAGRSLEAEAMLRVITGLEAAQASIVAKERLEDESAKAKVREAWHEGRREGEAALAQRIFKAIGSPYPPDGKGFPDFPAAMVEAVSELYAKVEPLRHLEARREEKR